MRQQVTERPRNQGAIRFPLERLRKMRVVTDNELVSGGKFLVGTRPAFVLEAPMRKCNVQALRLPYCGVSALHQRSVSIEPPSPR